MLVIQTHSHEQQISKVSELAFFFDEVRSHQLKMALRLIAMPATIRVYLTFLGF